MKDIKQNNDLLDCKNELLKCNIELLKNSHDEFNRFVSDDIKIIKSFGKEFKFPDEILKKNIQLQDPNILDLERKDIYKNLIRYQYNFSMKEGMKILKNIICSTEILNVEFLTETQQIDEIERQLSEEQTQKNLRNIYLNKYKPVLTSVNIKLKRDKNIKKSKIHEYIINNITTIIISIFILVITIIIK